MSGTSRTEGPHPPDVPSTIEDGVEVTWDDADRAMHRLLEAALISQGPSGDAGRARFLTPFLPESASAPGARVGRELSRGDILGKFHIEGELGRGGFGVVYRATDSHLRRTVALKVPRPDRVQSVSLWDRFAREARLAASLDHDAIVPVLDAGVLDGVFVLVAAYQEGETLSRWLASRYPTGMPPRLAASISLRMAGGIGHAHDHGVLHRDLKPANVLMLASAEPSGDWSPRITDFGMGTIHDEENSATLTGIWQGSPPYMAPEQVLPGLGRVDARSDLYALGAILYEMLTGRPIYSCSSLVELSVILGRDEPPVRPRRLSPGIPVDLETICLTCLERDPARRYPSASALHEDLSRFLDGRPIRARPIPIPARIARWAVRKPSHAALCGLAIVATAFTTALIVRHEWQLGRKNAELSRSNDRLVCTVAERDSANAVLKSTLDRLTASEREARRTAFAADLHLAERELEAGRVERAQTLLRRHGPVGEEPVGDDLRGFAWRYLMRKATRAYTVQPMNDFRWWRRKSPLVATFQRLGHRTQFHVLNSLPALILGRDGIRRSSFPQTFVLGRNFLEVSSVDPEGHADALLWFNDGRRYVRSAITSPSYTLSPDGRTLAISTDRPASGDAIPPLGRHPAACLPGGDRADGPTQLVSMKVVETLPGAARLNFSEDGNTLACLRAAGGVGHPLIYDLGSEWRASYPQYRTPLEAVGPGSGAGRAVLTYLVLSHDGRLAALNGDRCRLRVFETRTGRTLWSRGPGELGADAFISCMAFSEAGDLLATGDSRGRARLWQAMTGSPIAEFPVNVGYVMVIGFHPDDRTVAIIANDEDAIRLWTHSPDPEPPDRLDHGDEVWGLAFAGTGPGTLVSAGDDGRAKQWGPDGREISATPPSGTVRSAVAADLERGLIATGGFDGLLTIGRGGRLDSTVTTSRALLGMKIRSVAFAPSGAGLVAAGGSGPRVMIADVGPGGEILRERLIDISHRDVYGLAFSPDGKTLAMGTHDRAISLWDVPSFRHRVSLETRAAVTCLAYTPDGKALVSGDTEGGLRFWDMTSGTLRATLQHASETGGVWALAFSPDGKTLATGGDDGLVRLWDPELAVERLPLQGHEAKVHAVAFSPDGKTLASGDFNGVIRLWHAGP